MTDTRCDSAPVIACSWLYRREGEMGGVAEGRCLKADRIFPDGEKCLPLGNVFSKDMSWVQSQGVTKGERQGAVAVCEGAGGGQE